MSIPVNDARITFSSEHALAVYHSMAEGMSEVAEDDGETEKEALLSELITVTGASAVAFPVTVALPNKLADVAGDVLDNCLDCELVGSRHIVFER